MLSRCPSFFVSFLAVHAACGARQQFSTVDLNLAVTFQLPKGSSAVSHYFVFCKFCYGFSEIEKCSVVHIINFSNTAVDADFARRCKLHSQKLLPFCLGFVGFLFLSNFLCRDLKQSKYFNIVPPLNPKLSHIHLVSQILTPSESLLILLKDCLFVCLFVYCYFSRLICYVVVGDACFMFSIDIPLAVSSFTVGHWVSPHVLHTIQALLIICLSILFYCSLNWRMCHV